MGHTIFNIKHRLAEAPPLLYVPTANENFGGFFMIASMQKMLRAAYMMITQSTKWNQVCQEKNLEYERNSKAGRLRAG